MARQKNPLAINRDRPHFEIGDLLYIYGPVARWARASRALAKRHQL